VRRATRAASRQSRRVSPPTDLKMDGFMISLGFGWHPIVEGSKRLKGD
jgi:hypothetical protein